MYRLAWLIWLTGCGADPIDSATDDPSSNGACGDKSTHEITVLGRVVDASGSGVSGALVVLEDRGWDVGADLGEASTDGSGAFEIPDVEITDVDGCWGTLLDYVLVAEQGGRAGEKGINSQLHSAIDDGSFEADTSDFPVKIE